MAHPFGGHPKLKDYLEWLRTEKGFNYKTGLMTSEGSLMPLVKIIMPDGEDGLVIPGMDMEERLTPSEVERLDERLSVDSPFAKRPH